MIFGDFVMFFYKKSVLSLRLNDLLCSRKDKLTLRSQVFPLINRMKLLLFSIYFSNDNNRTMASMYSILYA